MRRLTASPQTWRFENFTEVLGECAFLHPFGASTVESQLCRSIHRTTGYGKRMTHANTLYFSSLVSVKPGKHPGAVTQEDFGCLEPRICSHGRPLRHKLIAVHTDMQYLYPMISASRAQPLYTSLRNVTMISSKISTSYGKRKEVCFDRRLPRCAKFHLG